MWGAVFLCPGTIFTGGTTVPLSWGNNVATLSVWSTGGATTVSHTGTIDYNFGQYNTFTTYDPTTGITTVTRTTDPDWQPGNWIVQPAPPGLAGTWESAPPNPLPVVDEPGEEPPRRRTLPRIPGRADAPNPRAEQAGPGLASLTAGSWCDPHGRPNCPVPLCAATTVHRVERHNSAAGPVDGCLRCDVEIAQRERQRLAHERRLEREAAMRGANDRARALLMSLLSPENRERFEQGRHILIRGSDGARWRIECNTYTGNVVRFDEDGFARRYCGHPIMHVGYADDGYGYQLPTLDAIIGQMLLLETNAERFLEIANPY